MNSATTITYGVRCVPALPVAPVVEARQLRASLASTRASSTIATTVIAGPISITTRYSLKRRARLRGRSTCQTKLSDASIFWIIEMTV